MKVDKAVLRETSHIALGLLAVDVLMCVVFFLSHRFDYTVVLGALLGSVFSLLNFFLLGLTIQKVIQKGEEPKKSVRLSYTLRMLMMMAVIVMGVFLPCFHVLAVIVPFLMTQPIILVMRALGVSKAEEKREEAAWKDSNFVKSNRIKELDDLDEGEL